MRILVAEYNFPSLKLASYLLEASGHCVVAVENGDRALCEARRGRYDLIIADIQMPDYDGHEFARQFRADSELRKTPLVAMTALAMNGDRARALDAGFDEYITKPIDPFKFVPTVEHVAARSSTETVARKWSSR